MRNQIQNYIDELFTDAPKTRKAMELKEELTQNTIEKYEDLISEGYQKEDAFQNVIGSIGDVNELFTVLEERNLLTLPAADRKKKAVLTAVSTGLYLFAGAVFLSFQLINKLSWIHSPGYAYFDYNLFGLILAILICIAPTCMLVYAAHMYPSFQKREDSLVEDYKQARHTVNRVKAIRNSISILIWTVTLTAYFIISFASWDWAYTWIIFLIGGCWQALVLLILSLRTDLSAQRNSGKGGIS